MKLRIEDFCKIHDCKWQKISGTSNCCNYCQPSFKIDMELNSYSKSSLKAFLLRECIHNQNGELTQWIAIEKLG